VWLPKHSLIKIAALYLAMILCMTFVSKAEITEWGGNELVANIRQALYFGSFFYVYALVKSLGDIRFARRLLIVFAVLGSILTIAQSIYGAEPMFGAEISSESDMQSFYNVSTWNQFDSIGGVLTRVNLPVISVIVWSFLQKGLSLAKRSNPSTLFMLPLFSAAIFIDYARGLFFGLFLSLAVWAWLEIRRRRKQAVATILRLSWIGGLVIASLILFAHALDVDYVSELRERLLSAQDDIATTSGSWDFRMDELRQFRDMEVTPIDVALGFGLFPHNSFIGLPYLHYGFGDVMYRGGVFFACILVIFLFKVLKLLIAITERIESRELQISAQACFLYLVVLLGFFVSANQLWSVHPMGVFNIALALVAVHVNILESADTRVSDESNTQFHQ